MKLFILGLTLGILNLQADLFDSIGASLINQVVTTVSNLETKEPEKKVIEKFTTNKPLELSAEAKEKIRIEKELNKKMCAYYNKAWDNHSEECKSDNGYSYKFSGKEKRRFKSLTNIDKQKRIAEKKKKKEEERREKEKKEAEKWLKLNPQTYAGIKMYSKPNTIDTDKKILNMSVAIGSNNDDKVIEIIKLGFPFVGDAYEKEHGMYHQAYIMVPLTGLSETQYNKIKNSLNKKYKLIRKEKGFKLKSEAIRGESFKRHYKNYNDKIVLSVIKNRYINLSKVEINGLIKEGIDKESLLKGFYSIQIIYKSKMYLDSVDKELKKQKEILKKQKNEERKALEGL